jgi:ATP-dependent Lon protease
MEGNGISAKELKHLQDRPIAIIQQYTQEAGLRQVGAEIGRISRKVGQAHR